MLSVLPPRLAEGRAGAGFPEEGFVSSAAVTVVAVASDDADWSVDAREVRFWFVGMGFSRAKG